MQAKKRPFRTIIGSYNGDGVAAFGPVIRELSENTLRTGRKEVGNTKEYLQVGLPGPESGKCTILGISIDFAFKEVLFDLTSLFAECSSPQNILPSTY